MYEELYIIPPWSCSHSWNRSISRDDWQWFPTPCSIWWLWRERRVHYEGKVIFIFHHKSEWMSFSLYQCPCIPHCICRSPWPWHHQSSWCQASCQSQTRRGVHDNPNRTYIIIHIQYIWRVVWVYVHGGTQREILIILYLLETWNPVWWAYLVTTSLIVPARMWP